MLFDAIFLTLFFLTWALLGAIPWLVWSLRRRAFGAIWALPFALLGGAGGGVAVPLLGLETGTGVGVSMVTAVAGGVLLTGAAFAAWDTYALGDRFDRLRVRPARPGKRRAAIDIALIARNPQPPKAGAPHESITGEQAEPPINSSGRHNDPGQG